MKGPAVSFDEALNALGENECFEYVDEGVGGTVYAAFGRIESLAAQIAASPACDCLVSTLIRPGYLNFITHVEHEIYAPGTPANLGFRVWVARWQEMYWHIVMFPLADRSRVEAVAARTGMAFAGGPPAIFEVACKAPRMIRFPLPGRVRTVESTEATGRPFYQASEQFVRDIGRGVDFDDAARRKSVTERLTIRSESEKIEAYLEEVRKDPRK